MKHSFEQGIKNVEIQHTIYSISYIMFTRCYGRQHVQEICLTLFYCSYFSSKLVFCSFTSNHSEKLNISVYDDLFLLSSRIFFEGPSIFIYPACLSLHTKKRSICTINQPLWIPSLNLKSKHICLFIKCIDYLFVLFISLVTSFCIFNIKICAKAFSRLDR